MITDYFSNNRDPKEVRKRKLDESSCGDGKTSLKNIFKDESTDTKLNVLQNSSIRKIRCKSGLKVDYSIIYSNITANKIYEKLEECIEYEASSQVKIFGKLIDIPRKQTAYGDSGIKYTFSGVTVPAKAWNNILIRLKTSVEQLCQCDFNYVLVNRYADGNEYMGEHRDDEKDLDTKSPIASLSFGQNRDFIFKHKNSRGKKNLEQSNIFQTHKLVLEHGSLLIMHYPTNNDWYHSLPKRSVKNCPNPRINLTFRKMVL